MKSTPPELDKYEIDEPMTNSSRVLPRAGWLVVLFSAAGIVASIYYHLRIPASIFMAMFVGSFTFSIYIQQFRKRKMKCRHCGGLMSAVDTGYPEKELTIFDGKDKPFESNVRSSFRSNSGSIYMIDSISGTNQYTFYRLHQRWYACNTCKLCFLGENMIYNNIGTCFTNSEAEAMKDNLIAGDKIA